MSIEDVPGLANHVLVAVADAGIAAVAASLARAGFTGVALHTCGAMGPEALAALQRDRERVRRPSSPPDHSQSRARRRTADGRWLCASPAMPGPSPGGARSSTLLEGFEIAVAPDGMPLYHAGAVLAGNGIVALLDAAVRLMQAAGVERRSALNGLAPLARASVENTVALDSVAALTGPVARGDAGTVATHARAMAGVTPDIRQLYRAVGLTALTIARRRGLPDSSADAIAEALDDSRFGDQS